MRKTEKIGIFNTWIGSDNIGDAIIMDCCKRMLLKEFKNDFYVEIPTHLSLYNKEFYIFNDLKYVFVCGTNLLSNKMNIRSRKNQWHIGIKFLYYIWKNKIDNIILLGVGWNNYSIKENFMGKLFWKTILSKKFIHSVRDEYTRDKLKNMGIENVINTGCPTTWDLTENYSQNIATEKSDTVVVTVTDYNRDYIKDKKMFDILEKNYNKIVIFPQSFADIDYVEELIGKTDKNKYEWLAPNLESYDEFLNNNSCDYVGTRLHGGIRALQKLKRTFIIGIDNRALEMKEINLPIINRENIEILEEKINKDERLNLKINVKKIMEWKNQFI